MRVHLCGPWDHGAPLRLHLNMKKWSVIIALTPGSRTQAWNRKTGYGDQWRWVVWHPSIENRCEYPIAERTRCPLAKGHKSPHYDWRQHASP